MNTTPQSDPSVRLRRYLSAIAKRDATGVAECFAQGAILDLPAIKPGRFMGLEEITTAHLWAFESFQEASVETDEVLADDHSAMAAGRLTVVRRGQPEIHAFGISVESADPGLGRVSWYFDSRGHRPWSDKTVL
jgi:SnoaL-like domain